MRMIHHGTLVCEIADVADAVEAAIIFFLSDYFAAGGGAFGIPNAALVPGSIQYARMRALTNKLKPTSANDVTPISEIKSKIRLKIEMMTRNIQPCGSTFQSIRNSQTQTQIINPHIITYQRLKSRNWMGLPMKYGR